MVAERELSPLQHDIVSAKFVDLYAATLDKISLRGAIAEGYEGYHELVRPWLTAWAPLPFLYSLGPRIGAFTPDGGSTAGEVLCDADVLCGGGAALQVIGGYKQVAEALADGVVTRKGPKFPVRQHIRFHREVTEVEAAEGGVRIRCRPRLDPQQGPEQEARAEEEVFEADCAVVTLPLGVLKKGRVAFSPALPAFKQEAIDALEMGTENRVAMVFDEVSCARGRRGPRLLHAFPAPASPSFPAWKGGILRFSMSRP